MRSTEHAVSKRRTESCGKSKNADPRMTWLRQSQPPSVAGWMRYGCGTNPSRTRSIASGSVDRVVARRFAPRPRDSASDARTEAAMIFFAVGEATEAQRDPAPTPFLCDAATASRRSLASAAIKAPRAVALSDLRITSPRNAHWKVLPARAATKRSIKPFASGAPVIHRNGR